MSEAIKPLLWIAEYDDDSSYLTVYERGIEDGKYDGVAICRLHSEINADLIAEAGTVFLETKRTPRQLVERVKELEEALTEAANLLYFRGLADGKVGELARAALSKALPNTVAEVK